jgi:hypothetical protein
MKLRKCSVIVSFGKIADVNLVNGNLLQDKYVFECECLKIRNIIYIYLYI